jgi:hypothetical protein
LWLKQSPDAAQKIVENLLRDSDETDVHIDDVGIFSNSWIEHLNSLRKVLTTLQQANFTTNPLKCEWVAQETDWLGHWLAPTGLKPWRKTLMLFSTCSRQKLLKSCGPLLALSC